MHSVLIRLRARATRAHLLAVAAATVAVSLSIVLTLAQPRAGSQRAPVPPASWVARQLQAWSGNPHGQTSSPASYASVLCVGSTAYVSVHLISDQPAAHHLPDGLLAGCRVLDMDRGTASPMTGPGPDSAPSPCTTSVRGTTKWLSTSTPCQGLALPTT